MYEETDALVHYGVKGMKWGVRKARPLSSNSKRKKTSAQIKLKQMSDEDLKKRIARLEMEKKYKELTAPQKSKGSKFVASVLETAGKDIATQYTAYYLGTAVNKVVGENVVDPKRIQKKK